MTLVRLKLRMFFAFLISSIVFFLFVWGITYLLQGYLPSPQIATISHVPLVNSIPFIGPPLNVILVFTFNAIMGPLFYPFLITVIFVLIQYLMGPSIVGRVMKLRYLKPGENQWLESTVKELADQSKVPTPKIAISPMKEANAFTFGRTAKGATLAVTDGLMSTLNKDEVRGVIGHELGHIKHKDYAMITILSALPLLAYMVSRVAFTSAYYAGGQRSSKDNNAGALIIAAGVLALLVWLVFTMIVRAVSRTREYLADRHSAVTTENPRSLQSALVKISTSLAQSRGEAIGLRAFFIADPVNSQNEIRDLNKRGMLTDKEITLAVEKGKSKNTLLSLNGLFSTHPPVHRRLEHLDRIAKETRKAKH